MHPEQYAADEHEDTVLIVGAWTYAGTGWRTTADAALALAAADAARARRPAGSRTSRRRRTPGTCPPTRRSSTGCNSGITSSRRWARCGYERSPPLGWTTSCERCARPRGVSTAKTCRTVVSGVMGLAVRYGAVSVNPTREATRVRGSRRRAPRALTAEERERWLSALEADPRAVRKDLPDLTRWLLATGLRIGEALAVSWSDVDLDAGTVEVDWKLIRIKGEGLLRVRRLKGGDDRTLPLPQFAVDMRVEGRLAPGCARR